MALRSTQPLTEMSTRGISWGKGGRCVRLTTYHYLVPLSRNLGTLTSWNPLGHSRSVMGLLYLFFLHKFVSQQCTQVNVNIRMSFQKFRELCKQVCSQNRTKMQKSKYKIKQSLQPWTGPQGCRRLRPTQFLAHEGGEVVGPLPRPPSPQHIPQALISVRGWVDRRAIYPPKVLSHESVQGCTKFRRNFASHKIVLKMCKAFQNCTEIETAVMKPIEISSNSGYCT